MNVYGYVRVSSRDQSEDRQLIAMKKLGVPEYNIYVDKESGRDFDRPMYREMVRELNKNDLVYIKSIDRLGRNYKEIVEQWQFLTRDVQADIVVIDMPLLDTRRGKDLLGTFLSDIVLQVLSFVAENERDNIRSRQREGIEAAKERGVKFGRPRNPLPDNFPEIYDQWKRRKISAPEAAAVCGLSRSTFYERVREFEDGNTSNTQNHTQNGQEALFMEQTQLQNGHSGDTIDYR